jgi:hypothetical protein
MLSLGVECNLAKSIVSPKGLGLEFAKKTFFLGENVSPSPLKEFYSATQSLVGFVEYCKKYSLSLPACAKVAGFGYRVIGGLNRPYHMLNLKIRYFIMIMTLNADTVHVSFSHMRRHLSKSEFITQYLSFLLEQYTNFVERMTRALKKAESFDPDDPGFYLEKP